MERRESLKKKFNNDRASLSDEELLELLLYYSGLKDGAEEKAAQLIKAFGSLNGVITAPEPALKRHGISDNAAILLALAIDLERQINADACKEIRKLDGVQKAIDYCRNVLCTDPLENMIIITLDENSKIIQLHRLTVLGTVSSVTVSPQEIMKRVIFDNAHSIIVAHNHPHGYAEASTDDVEFTLKTMELLRNVGVSLKDHIIIGEGCAMSMRCNEKLKDYFD